MMMNIIGLFPDNVGQAEMFTKSLFILYDLMFYFQKQEMTKNMHETFWGRTDLMIINID